MTEVSLAEISSLYDCEHRTAPPAAEGEEYALSVGTRDIIDGRFAFDNCKRVSRETYESWTSRARPEWGDIIFAREAPVGQAGFVDGSRRLCLGQRTVLIRPTKDLVEPRFLHYAILSPQVQRWIMQRCVGSTVLRINVSDVREMEFPFFPSLHVQRRIAAVIGVLDDLIETNQRLVGAIDECAQAIAKTVLNDASCEIPLRRVCTHRAGKYLAKGAYSDDGAYLVYGSNSVMGRHSESLVAGPVTIMARIGSNCGALRLSPEDCWVNNNASALSSSNGLPYVLHEVLRAVVMDEHRAGTGQPFIRIDSLLDAVVKWPDSEAALTLETELAVLRRAASSIDGEVFQLAHVRDELLPLLMSGRVSPGEVDLCV